jgi:hypothetical protein
VGGISPRVTPSTSVASTPKAQTRTAVGSNDPYLTFAGLLAGAYAINAFLVFNPVSTVAPEVTINFTGTSSVNSFFFNSSIAGGGGTQGERTMGTYIAIESAGASAYCATLSGLLVLSGAGSATLGWGGATTGGSVTLVEGSWALLNKVG